MQPCKHQHGAQIDAFGCWVCGQCFNLLEERPKRYETPFGISKEMKGPEPVQIIAWQAEIRKSGDGTTLATFLKAVARRFKSRAISLSDHDAHSMALDAVKGMDAEFGHPDYDWSRLGAIDVADEEMAYWDEEAPAGNR